MRTAFASLAGFALMLTGGCASMQGVLESKDKGTAEVYAVTEEQAWKISKKVFRWEGCDAIEEDHDANVMLTGSGMNAVGWGSLMAAWVEPVDSENTRVTVVTKRKMQLGIATTLTEGTYHRRFAQAVEIVQSGDPLPLEPPPLEKQR